MCVSLHLWQGLRPDLLWELGVELIRGVHGPIFMTPTGASNKEITVSTERGETVALRVQSEVYKKSVF